MSATTLRTRHSSLAPDDYLDLVRQFRLRVIKTAAEFRLARSGKRGLSKRLIAKLSTRFRISPIVFLNVNEQENEGRRASTA
jgi:hypothetical protein